MSFFHFTLTLTLPMTLILKLDLDMVKIYLYPENGILSCSRSKGTAQSDRHTDRQIRLKLLPVCIYIQMAKMLKSMF